MKRFTDTDKWTKNKWFRKLPAKYKLFWIFIIDQGDSVGVWREDVDFASLLIGFEYTIDELLNILGDRIKVFDGGKKWWIKDFCEFQYGYLDETQINNRPHQSYIRELKKHSLWIDYKRTLYCPKEKDKDIDKDKDKEKDKEKDIESFENFWEIYDHRLGKSDCEDYWFGRKKLKSGKSINEEDKKQIFEFLPLYVENTHKDGNYPSRKHPKTYLYNSAWKDEIIISEDSGYKSANNETVMEF